VNGGKVLKSKVERDRRWEMGDGRWEMGDGRWEMGDGRWAGRRDTSATVGSERLMGTSNVELLSFVLSFVA
jgi:hypothetical protein